MFQIKLFIDFQNLLFRTFIYFFSFENVFMASPTHLHAQIECTSYLLHDRIAKERYLTNFTIVALALIFLPSVTSCFPRSSRRDSSTNTERSPIPGLTRRPPLSRSHPPSSLLTQERNRTMRGYSIADWLRSPCAAVQCRSYDY